MSEADAPQTDSLAGAPWEKRRAPRVAAARPARLHLGENGSVSAGCAILDISRDGCRLSLPTRDLPRDHVWAIGSACTLQILLDAVDHYRFPAQIVWSQRTRDMIDLVGLRFLAPGEEATASIERFILLRLRCGLQLPDPPASAPAAVLAVLEVPLEAEARRPGKQDPVRFLVHAVGGPKMELRWVAAGPPPVAPGELLELAVFPPTWARGEKRTLRFAARVKTADPAGAELEFASLGNDLSQMLRDLIPPKIVYVPPPKPVDYRWIAFVLFIILMLLLQAAMREMN